MSARHTDINGFVTIKGNPISKEGVFEYSGAQIGLNGPDADRIFKVYRPGEELADPECIESFKLLPFINEHTMLGSEDNGLTPPERKGVEGMIGEDVYYDAPYLRGTLRIVSESLKNALAGGKVELSPGYRCVYEMTPGVFNGERYDAIQRKIRGNHLALVDEGRTGPDVAVLDRMTFTVDSNTLKEAVDMAEEMKDQEGSGGLDRIKALIEELKPLIAEQAEAQALLAELGMGPKVEEKEEEIKVDSDTVTEPAADEDKPAVPAADADPEKAAMDARIKQLEAQVAAMDGKLVSGIADRDALATKLSEFVGTFDSARMTASQVAEYGVKKLGIPCAKGTERIALDAWLHGRTPERHKPAIAQDGKGVDLFKIWGAK
jgi:uncharacterized protein